jgi:hypothetical protein
MRRRSKSENQEFRVRIAEAGNRFAPIFPFAKCEPLVARHFFPVFNKPRTFPAAHNLGI